VAALLGLLALPASAVEVDLGPGAAATSTTA
jgi:hypothetical protein